MEYLAYLDMDLMVTDMAVDFAARYLDPRFDLTLTDHNRMWNNGAFILRNTDWTWSFLERWANFSARGREIHTPFTDNGSFLETLLSYSPTYKECMVPSKTSAKAYLDCAAPQLNQALGPFTGAGDRILNTPNGGARMNE